MVVLLSVRKLLSLQILRPTRGSTLQQVLSETVVCCRVEGVVNGFARGKSQGDERLFDDGEGNARHVGLLALNLATDVGDLRNLQLRVAAEGEGGGLRERQRVRLERLKVFRAIGGLRSWKGTCVWLLSDTGSGGGRLQRACTAVWSQYVTTDGILPRKVFVWH